MKANALWSEAAKYRFSQSDGMRRASGLGRYLIDDTQDDIPTFGGIFRGRAKTFQITLTAPTQPGTYLNPLGDVAGERRVVRSTDHAEYRNPRPDRDRHCDPHEWRGARSPSSSLAKPAVAGAV